ncbi:1045_t:CDS:2, partial [Gigaspora margarita]
LKPEHGKDGSQALVKSEVREAIPEAKCSDEALRKRMERSEKVYKLLNGIGKERIARIKSTPPGHRVQTLLSDIWPSREINL